MKVLPGYGFWCRAVLLLMLLVTAGCSTTDIWVGRQPYQPVGEGSGSGTLVLASALEGTVAGSGERLKWVLGEVKDTNGKVKAEIAGPVAPAALIRDALQQELQRVGYQLQPGKELPANVGQAVVLGSAVLTLDETQSLVKMEAECRVSFSVDIWVKGAKTTTLSFESRFSDFAVKNRDKLYQEVLQKALASAFRRAVPAIVEQLKK